MSSNLYEVLGISRNATSEDVRRAYRRRALETHPDRLPQGASAAEKATSEDLFRQVNNAYEVLSDPQNRAAYDQHGVWPPPTSPPQGHFANGSRDPFSDQMFRDPFSQHPFFRGPRMDPFGGFAFGSRPRTGGFTDPFVLFNSIFGDLHRAFENDPFFDDSFGRRGFGSSPYNGGFFGGGFPSLSSSPFNSDNRGMGGSRMQMFSSGGNGGGWVSQSWTSSTVNGVTHTKSVHKDSQGNEHAVYRYPDGTERRTVNGVEQSSAQPLRALPSSAPAPPVSYPTQADNMPPPPYSEAVPQQPSRSRSSRHHGYYGEHSGDRNEHRSRHGHEHSSRDKERDRDREYEMDYGYGHRGSGHGHDTQGSSSWKFWKS